MTNRPKLLDAATPGPVAVRHDDHICSTDEMRYIATANRPADAEFIAWCFNNVPALLDALAAAEAMINRKGFPILGQRGVYVDWQLVADHGGQVDTNHGQTVARLAERGGLSWCELFAVLHNQRHQKMDQNEALIACRALEARYLAALKAGGAA